MPNLPDRDEREKALAVSLLSVFSPYSAALGLIEPPRRAGSAVELAAALRFDLPKALRPNLEATFIEAANRLRIKRRAEIERQRQEVITLLLLMMAEAWAVERSAELADLLAESTVSIVDRYVERARSRFDPQRPQSGVELTWQEALAASFSGDRVDVVSITETTNAITAGELWYNDEILGPVGEGLEPTWFTEDDERVCSICFPLHGLTRSEWQEINPDLDGPAAHPRCRCWLEYV